MTRYPQISHRIIITVHFLNACAYTVYNSLAGCYRHHVLHAFINYIITPLSLRFQYFFCAPSKHIYYWSKKKNYRWLAAKNYTLDCPLNNFNLFCFRHCHVSWGFLCEDRDPFYNPILYSLRVYFITSNWIISVF